MKVAFISYFYPNVFRCGSATYASNLCSALAKYVNVTVFVPKLPLTGNEKLKTEFVRFIDLPILRLTSFSIMSSMKLKNMSFDVIHSNESAGAFLKNVSVETFHHKSSYLMAYGSIQKICLKKTEHIIAVSERSKNELIRMGVDERKISVVHNGVNYKKFCPKEDHRIRRRLNLEGEKVLLYVGSEGVTPRKNMSLLLKTMMSLEEEGCILLVVSKKKGMKKFLKTARRLNVAEKIYYVCDIPDEHLPYYYSTCDFLVYPSLKEGFGLVLLEAIASGKPFVSMDVGIAPELADAGFGYVAKTEDEFLVKCSEMLEKPIDIGSKGHEFVKSKYSWDKCARETVKIYEKIV